MKTIQLILTTSLLITSCATNKTVLKEKSDKNLVESKYNIVDEGTICIQRDKNRLLFTYFPLSKTNFPRSQYKDFKTYMYLTPKGADFVVETITSFTKINRSIATTDFTSYMQKKSIYMDARGAITIHWGFTILGTFSNKEKDIICYKKKGKNVSIDNNILNSYKQLTTPIHK